VKDRFSRSEYGRNDVRSDGQERANRLQTVFLVGFMGAGKTSVGHALSRRLGLPFEDLDDRIEDREGKTIAQIFRESGEAGFRRAETAALRALLEEPVSSSRLVALGGGAFVEPVNAVLMNDAQAISVFLDAPVEELFRRCDEQERVRPLRQNPKQFRDLYEKRSSSYSKASLRIETGGKDVEAVAAEVACSLGLE